MHKKGARDVQYAYFWIFKKKHSNSFPGQKFFSLVVIVKTRIFPNTFTIWEKYKMYKNISGVSMKTV
jgi:hypothetical protein